MMPTVACIVLRWNCNRGEADFDTMAYNGTLARLEANTPNYRVFETRPMYAGSY
jgi:hypothetical protein